MNIFGSPNFYFQGQGILDQMAEILSPLGSRFFIFADEIVSPLVKDRVTKAMEKGGKIPIFEIFRGECCYPEIFRLKAIAEEGRAQAIVGIGGGKAIDTAKALNLQLNLPVAIVPTIAASDAASTPVAIVYDENHVKLEVLRMKLNVACILVDTEMIAQAPTRFLLAGMGDALSTKFEAEACSKSGAKNILGGSPCQIALGFGQMAYEIIREHGEEAKASVDQKRVTPALEKVIEANLLLSGLGAMSGGIAAAHAIYGGFTLIEEMHQSLHGELVAFGTLVQLILENREDAFIHDLVRFYRRVGLPTNLNQLGFKEVNMQKLEKAAKKICASGSYMHNMPFQIDEWMVIDAILKADSLA